MASGSSTSDAAIMLPVALARASTPVRKRLHRRPRAARLEVQLVPHQHDNAQEPDHQAQRTHPWQPVLQPKPSDDRAPDGGDRVGHRQEAGAQGLGRVGVQQERYGGVQGANHQQRLPVPGDHRPLAAPHRRGPQEQRGQADTKLDQRDRTEIADGDAHEQEGAAPDRRKQQQVQQIALTHGLSRVCL
ncbi:hypothetical protein G6F61_013978 [Rhizopus arrhizus]|nr:hypothetical protein G6F61_013978 [Rhizopus arrhizus]